MVYTLCVYHKLDGLAKVSAIYILVVGVLQMWALILFKYSQNNLFILSLLIPLRFGIAMWGYSKFLVPFISKKYFVYSVTIMISASVINSLLFEKVGTINHWAMTVEGLVLLTMSIASFIFLMDKRLTMKLGDLQKTAMLYNAGILIFYMSATLYMYFMGHLFSSSYPVSIFKILNFLHTIEHLILFSFFFLTIWNRPALSR